MVKTKVKTVVQLNISNFCYLTCSWSEPELICSDTFRLSNQSTMHCTVESSTIGLIQPYTLKPDTDCQEEEEQLLVQGHLYTLMPQNGKFC